VELEYSHFDIRLFTSVLVLDSFRLCVGWGPPPLFLGVGFGVFLGVFRVFGVFFCLCLCGVWYCIATVLLLCCLMLWGLSVSGFDAGFFGVWGVFRVPFGELRRFRGGNGCPPYYFYFCVSRGVWVLRVGRCGLNFNHTHNGVGYGWGTTTSADSSQWR
jgi:hypothetical protein